MFFLRCAFWLSIVYASMSWPTAEFGPATSKPSSPLLSVSGLARSAADGAQTYCVKHVEDCLAGAARLTALVDAANQMQANGEMRRESRMDAAIAVTPTQGANKDVPLPVPDPRRVASTSHSGF